MMMTIKLVKSERNLLEKALKAMMNAHVLWGSSVGAAVLAEDGRIYEGCNVETWISGLGICAERNSINHAIIHGNRRVKEIAIATDAGNREAPRPCGACLQYLYDFAGDSKVKIIMAETKDDKILPGTVQVKTLEELLPFPHRR
jgi:cytidine deaminase